MRLCDSIEPAKLYKRRYCLAFYDKTGEYLLHLFDNIIDILEFQKKENNKANKNILKVELCRALKSEEHFCKFLTGKVMRVYLIDMSDENMETW